MGKKRAMRDSSGKPEIRYVLCFPNALKAMAAACTYGASKYAEYDFKNGQPVSQCIDALERHALAFWNGEDDVPDATAAGFDVLHVGAMLYNVMQAAEAAITGNDLDDRPHRVLAKRRASSKKARHLVKAKPAKRTRR